MGAIIPQALVEGWIKPFINFDDIEIVLCMAMSQSKLRLFNRNRTCIVVHTEERIDSNDERQRADSSKKPGLLWSWLPRM